jgi:hypothetical protein
MAAENIARRLIREPETQVGHGAHDPVIAPPGFSFAIRTTNRSVSSSTLGRPRDLRNFDPSNLLAMSFRYAAYPASRQPPILPTLSVQAGGRAQPAYLFRHRITTTSFDLGSQDAVLCGQIFVPQFLVYGSGDVSKHASPNHSRASLNLIVEPGLYLLLRFSERSCARRL